MVRVISGRKHEEEMGALPVMSGEGWIYPKPKQTPSHKSHHKADTSWLVSTLHGLCEHKQIICVDPKMQTMQWL